MDDPPPEVIKQDPVEINKHCEYDKQPSEGPSIDTNQILENHHTITSEEKKDQILELFKKPVESHKELLLMKRESILRRVGDKSNILPLWSGRLVLPGVSWCDTSAIFHSVVGPFALGPELGRFAHFNLPTDLTIQGRISTESFYSYLRQVIKSASRAIGIAQFIGKYNSQRAPSTIKPAVEIETPFHESLLTISTFLQSNNRLGVIYSGLNPPSSFSHADMLFDKKTGLSSYHGWYIKDLYLLPCNSDKDLPEPLANIDMEQILMEAINLNQDQSHQYRIDNEAFEGGRRLTFMIFIFSRMPPAVLTEGANLKMQTSDFKYKRLS